MATILSAKEDNFLAVIGLVCSSFVSISSGTHRRAPWDPLGQQHIGMVALGNLLASRMLGLQISGEVPSHYTYYNLDMDSGISRI